MDYQFIRNDYNEPEAIFSGSHVAIGYFLSSELANKLDKINEIREALSRLETLCLESFEWLGKEYKLVIEKDDVSITALVLDHELYDDLPESTELYDDEQKSECGLLDFSDVLEDWLAFIGDYA